MGFESVWRSLGRRFMVDCLEIVGILSRSVGKFEADRD
jgi:hypothetical protein